MRLLLSVLMITGLHTAIAQEWTAIYYGKDMEGWNHVRDGSFVIEEGLLVTKGGMGLLWYTGQKFENAKIRVVYKGADQSNAGVFIRIPEKPTEAWMPVNKGYEVQISDNLDTHHQTAPFC